MSPLRDAAWVRDRFAERGVPRGRTSINEALRAGEIKGALFLRGRWFVRERVFLAWLDEGDEAADQR